MRDYDMLLTAGTAAQREKLEANTHKKGFDHVNLSYAYHRICQEREELRIEIFGNPASEPVDYKAIRAEAADIANFAHMIILRCDQEIENV